MFGKTLSTFAAAAALFASATADVAPGFPIPAAGQLTVIYGNNTVSPPGERIPRPETAQPPTILVPQWLPPNSSSTTALLLMVDLDVPRNNTRVQLLHWLATNITLYLSPSTGAPTTQLLIRNDAAPAPYLQPSPPVGDVPHSYTFILFPQPADFRLPPQYANLSTARVPFNVAQFAADVGLGSALAGNYITVQNLTGSATATFPPARPTASPTPSGNGTVVFTGATMRAASLDSAAMWLGLAAAMLVGVMAVGF
ncbi:hypothetical protein ACN47E_009657 [Coniothyrium glycines]